MCLAIMDYAVCRKKVLMENPLNVLGGNLGDLGGILQIEEIFTAIRIRMGRYLSRVGKLAHFDSIIFVNIKINAHSNV